MDRSTDNLVFLIFTLKVQSESAESVLSHQLIKETEKLEKSRRPKPDKTRVSKW